MSSDVVLTCLSIDCPERTGGKCNAYQRMGMDKLVIAFDVDGTLIENGAMDEFDMKPNRRVVSLLIGLAHSKNVKIIVWSGAGKDWAESAVRALKLEKFVKGCYDKNLKGRDPDTGNYIFEPEIIPDIAFDDIQACHLGLLNVIVREK